MESRVNVVTVASDTGNFTFQASSVFTDFQWKEEYVESLLVNGAILFPKNDVKIIGRQVISEFSWKADLVGLKRNGDLVIIEVKRDTTDMLARKEPCEMQVIRYASGFMDINSIEDIVSRIYYPFSRERADIMDKSNEEIYSILFSEIQAHIRSAPSVNKHQHLMIVASGFDSGTISACNWLLNNNIIISCMQISPFKNEDGRVVLVVDRLFPLESMEELQKRIRKRRSNFLELERNKFLTISEMFDAGLLSPKQKIFLKGTDESADIIDSDKVKNTDGKEMSWNEWAKKYKTGSFSIYHYVCIGGKNGKTLHQLRMGIDEGILPFINR